MAYKYPYEAEEKAPTRPKLATNRSMWKLMILNLLTLGIYSVIFFIPFTFDFDRITKSHSSNRFNYLWAYLLAIVTLNIAIDAWHYQMARDIEIALADRQIEYEFGTSDFWMWFIFGSFILVGPFVYFHKLCRAMNLLCENYNEDTECETA